MDTATLELEAKIATLERKLEMVTEYCQELEERIKKLALVKCPEPRFPFWNWQLCRGMSREEWRRLSVVLSFLEDRVAGEPVPEALHKDIGGIPQRVLFGDEPLDPGEACDAVKWVTGIEHEDALIELLEALFGQGMFRSLCPFLLKTLRDARQS